MSKYTVTLTATSIKTFEIEAHSAEEAIAITNDIRDHTEMLNFTEADVTEMETTAEPATPVVEAVDTHEDEDDGEDILVEQIYAAATDLHFAMQLLLNSLDSLDL